MHTIIGTLRAVELHDEHGLAQLQYEIDQRSRYNSRQTVRALCCIGRTAEAHATAARIVEHAAIGATYTFTGDCLAAIDSQVWLMGVTSAVRKPSAHVACAPAVRDHAGAMHA